MSTKEAKKLTRFVTMLVILCVSMAMLSGCTHEEMTAWVEGNFGIKVTVKEVALANGTMVYEWVSGDYNNEQMAQLDLALQSDYNITKLRDATTKYNCHSYAWYSQSSNNKYWIEDPANFRTNWFTSTGWTNVIPSNAKNGDKVDYYVNDNNRPHSAIVYDAANNLFVSKWGPAGLYIHSPTEGPRNYWANQLGYYRP